MTLPTALSDALYTAAHFTDLDGYTHIAMGYDDGYIIMALSEYTRLHIRVNSDGPLWPPEPIAVDGLLLRQIRPDVQLLATPREFIYNRRSIPFVFDPYMWDNIYDDINRPFADHYRRPTPWYGNEPAFPCHLVSMAEVARCMGPRPCRSPPAKIPGLSAPHVTSSPAAPKPNGTKDKASPISICQQDNLCSKLHSYTHVRKSLPISIKTTS